MGDLLYPAIPDPIATTESLLESIVALKQAVELLNGQRVGTGQVKAVTAADLNYIFGTGGGTGGVVIPGTGTAGSAALAQARAQVQLALADLRNVIDTNLTELENEQQAALSELQALLDQETGLRIDGDNAIQAQVDAIILTNNEGAIAAIVIETGLRIAADDALAGQITTVQAGVDGNTALITDEQVARADGDSALATDINNVTAIASKQRVFSQSVPPTGSVSAPLIIGDIWIDTANGNLLKVWDGGAWIASDNEQIEINRANILNEATARADADEAIANEIDTLTVSVGDANVLISEEATARADADTAIGIEIDTIQVSVSNNTAAITTEAGARADADGVLAGRITTVEGAVNTNAASIVTETGLRIDGDEALAFDISTVAASAGNNAAAIVDEQIARADGDEALAADIDTLTASVGNNAAAIVDEQTARADGDSALADDITTLTSNTGTSIANINNQLTTITSVNNAQASSISSLTTTVGSHTASINTQQTSINGLLAEYSLTVNVNGHISGFSLNSSPTVSEFIILADKFKVVNAAGGAANAPFAVTAGNTYINRVIVAEEILSPNYAVDGLGNPAAGFRAGTDGKIRAEDARFTDFQARGGNFTERPVLLATPNFRNGVPDSLAFGNWSSPGNIAWNPALAWLNMVAYFHRTPENFYASFTQLNGAGDQFSSINQYFVPVGKRLPPVIVADFPGGSNIVEWRDNGTIVRTQYNSNGGISAQNTALGWWIYDVEKDPLNLAGFTKMYAGLGFSRYPQPLRVPVCSTISFKCWGAGGAKNDGAADGGAGGYVAGTFTVGPKTSTALIKHGDMLWLIPGQGGKSKVQEVIFGFGGRGQAQERRASGGGLSGVFIHSVTRGNALLIAGGGGGAEGGQTGGAGGHNTLSGNNGVSLSAPDDEIMTGLPWIYDGSNQKAAGGGGYVGGGYLTASGGNAGGRGGSNFVHALASSSVNTFLNAGIPPNTSDPDYTARPYCLGNDARVGEGKTDTATLECGGNGLIVVSFA